MKATAEQKFKNEHRALLNRWIDESDIEDTRICEIVAEDVNEWINEDIVEFESDINLEEEDDA
tara:strand:- start:15728 stop:15916 length:189 start_codon:yes stop_codon:yes gene_type:complete